MPEEIQNDHDLKFSEVNIIIGKPPSLELLSLNRISINLFRNHFRQIDSNLLCIEDVFETMEILEVKILERIPDLLIPKNCKIVLEQMINSLKKNLEKYLFQEDLYEYFTSVTLFNILDNICFSQLGTINYAKTAVQLIDNAPLSTNDKYKLACNNCLEEKIRNLQKLLPEDFIENYDVQADCLIIFWTFMITEKLEIFLTYIEGDGIWDYILKWAISDTNEVAVKYIWEHFADQEMKSRVNDYLNYNMERCSNVNLCHYFFQQMSEIHILNLELDKIKLLLEKYYTLTKWYDLPPIAKYIPGLMKKYDALNAVDFLLFCWQKKIICLDQYKTLWEYFSHHFELDLENNFINICHKILASRLLLLKDIVTIKLFLNNNTKENIKKFLASEDGLKTGIQYCVILITIEGPVIFDTFLKYVFEDEEKIVKFKKEIFEKESLALCVGLTSHGKYEWVNRFLSDCITHDQISEYKINLPFKYNEDFIKCISKDAVYHERNFLTSLNNILFWCFDGEEKEIKRYKATVFDVDVVLYRNEKDIYFQVLHNLVLEMEWKLAEEYMNWIYFSSNVNKRTTKQKVVRIKKILRLISRKSNLKSSMRFIACHELLEKFMTSCFQQNEIEELKKRFDYKNYSLKVVGSLIKYSDYEKCDTYLNWFYSSNEVKINKFKTSFMCSRGRSILYKMIKDGHLLYGRDRLFKWFDPSQESAKLFTNNFISYVNFKRELKRQKIEANDESKNKFESVWTQLNKNMYECVEIIENMALNNKRKSICSINLNQESEEVIDETSCLNKKRKIE